VLGRFRFAVRRSVSRSVSVPQDIPARHASALILVAISKRDHPAHASARDQRTGPHAHPR
jgi:hypothetical protein